MWSWPSFRKNPVEKAYGSGYGELLGTVEYDYSKFHLSMDCFICSIKSGNLVLKEHEAAKWLEKENLDSVDWLPADSGLIEKIRKYL